MITAFKTRNLLYLIGVFFAVYLAYGLSKITPIHGLNNSYYSLYPEMITVLISLHVILSSFMFMAFICERKKLYLLSFSLGFAFSGIFLVLALYLFYANSSYHEYFTTAIATSYFIRYFILAVFFMLGLILYKFKDASFSKRKQILIVFSQVLFGLVSTVVFVLSFNEKSSLYNIMQCDFKAPFVVACLLLIWMINSILITAFTRLKNPFWTALFITIFLHIISLIIMYATNTFEQVRWYTARVFEIVATLSILHILLQDVFYRYKTSVIEEKKSQFLAEHDGMTMLFNRKSFHSKVTLYLSENIGKDVSVIIGDIDLFKKINDTWGHLQGDRVIIRIAKFIIENIRKNDIAGRIGGEEFAIFLPETKANIAFEIAERIRETIQEQDKKSTGGDFPCNLTISFGVYTQKITEYSTADTCIDFADKALYTAKNNGRNKTEIIDHQKKPL